MQSQIEHNKELARRFYMEEVWVQGKLDLLDEFVAPEILDLGMGIKNVISGLLAAFSDSRITCETVIAEGDLVAAHHKWRAVHTGVWEFSHKGLSMAVMALTGSRRRVVFLAANHRRLRYFTRVNIGCVDRR